MQELGTIQATRDKTPRLAHPILEKGCLSGHEKQSTWIVFNTLLMKKKSSIYAPNSEKGWKESLRPLPIKVCAQRWQRG